MVRTSTVSAGLWAVKSTPADALDDATAVLKTVHGRMSMTEFIDAMRARGVTVGAAQDVLKYLEGRGIVAFTNVGDVFPEPAPTRR